MDIIPIIAGIVMVGFFVALRLTYPPARTPAADEIKELEPVAIADAERYRANILIGDVHLIHGDRTAFLVDDGTGLARVEIEGAELLGEVLYAGLEGEPPVAMAEGDRVWVRGMCLPYEPPAPGHPYRIAEQPVGIVVRAAPGVPFRIRRVAPVSSRHA